MLNVVGCHILVEGRLDVFLHIEKISKSVHCCLQLALAHVCACRCRTVKGLDVVGIDSFYSEVRRGGCPATQAAQGTKDENRGRDHGNLGDSKIFPVPTETVVILVPLRDECLLIINAWEKPMVGGPKWTGAGVDGVSLRNLVVELFNIGLAGVASSQLSP